MPVPKDLVSIKRTAAALRRLGVSDKILASAPQITPMLKNADGGLTQVVAAMRFSQQDPVVAAFLKKYDSIPAGDRERIPMEAVALAAEVDVSHLLGSIMLALQAQAVNAVKIIAMTAHPKITQARVMYGQLPYGEKDRTALDTAMGFLPSPKGPTFIGKAIFAGKNVEETGDDDEGSGGGEEKEIDYDRLFPPANAMQEKLVPIRQRMLPPASS